jgi:hypothetical protein
MTENEAREQAEMIERQADIASHAGAGVPAGARQNVRLETMQGAVSRPGGATQNSGGAQEAYDEERGHGPGRGAD